MSVLRWLLTSVLLAMLAVLAGTLLLMADTARIQLGEQQERHAQDVATTLALVLTQTTGLDTGQRAALLADTFDTAGLEAIRYTGAQGEVLFEQSRAAGQMQHALPGWFQSLLPLDEAVATRRLMLDGQAVGELRVSVQADQVRAALWRSVLSLCALFAVASILLTVLIVWIMAAARRALQQLVLHPVENFGREADWSGEEPPPAWQGKGAAAGQISELKPAADAIRNMQARVSATVKERSEKIEQLQLELNTDAVTQLANRRYFINALRQQLQARPVGGDQEAGLGHVILMRQRDLAIINQQLSRTRTDEWLQGLAAQLLSYAQTHIGDQAVLARLNGSDLALLLPGASMIEANRHAQGLLAVLSARRIALGEGRWCRWALAMTDCQASDDVSSVFNNLDQALMQAEHAGHGEIGYLASSESRPPSGAGQSLWRERIQRGLRQHDFQLDFQCWHGVNGRAYYPARHEATLGMLERDENQLLSAYLLMPVAARVGLAWQCDAEALSLGLAWLEEHAAAEIVLRVSLVSLATPEFEARICSMLARHRSAAPRMIIELDAYALSAQAQRDHGGDVAGLCRRLHSEFGMRVGLRALTQQIDVMYRLGELACAYVKLGEDFIDLLHSSTGARELLRALVRTARAGGIEVVTMRVSDPEERDWLRREGVGSLQLNECC